ncbi:MAG: hypothetical protein RL296_1198 [Actinomycetota bacterium]
MISGATVVEVEDVVEVDESETTEVLVVDARDDEVVVEDSDGIVVGTEVVDVVDVVDVDVVEVDEVDDVVDEDDDSETVVVDESVAAIVVGVTPTVVVEAIGSSCANTSEQTNSCATSSAARAGATGNIANTATHERSTHTMRVEDAKRFLHCAKGVVCTHYKVGT